jgi:hypothetical protein
MRRALSKALLDARRAQKNGKPTEIKVPELYAIEQLAARWGIPPWEMNSDDPEVGLWIRRGLIFRRLES